MEESDKEEDKDNEDEKLDEAQVFGENDDDDDDDDDFESRVGAEWDLLFVVMCCNRRSQRRRQRGRALTGSPLSLCHSSAHAALSSTATILIPAMTGRERNANRTRAPAKESARGPGGTSRTRTVATMLQTSPPFTRTAMMMRRTRSTEGTLSIPRRARQSRAQS